MTSHKTSRERGYTQKEILIFLTALSLIGTATYLVHRRLNTEEQLTRAQAVIVSITRAKVQFDSSASASDKKKFDETSDENRFKMLSSILGSDNPVALTDKTGLREIKIGKLTTPVSAN